MTQVKTIYADFNDFDADGILPLICRGSRDSIAAHPGLCSGEEVVLSDGDMSVVATVTRKADGTWEANSDWKFRYHSDVDGKTELPRGNRPKAGSEVVPVHGAESGSLPTRRSEDKVVMT